MKYALMTTTPMPDDNISILHIMHARVIISRP